MTGIIKTDQLQGAQGTTVTVPTGHTLAVTSNATIGGTLGVTGNTTMGGTAAITGNTTVGGTLVNTGLITASAGVAIGGTGSANTLDDYEEGSFTPTWNSYSPAGSSGKFVKVGNQVTVYAKLITGTSNDGSSVGITNLPFTISGDIGAGSIYHNTVGLRGIHLVTRFNSNSTICFLDGENGGSDTTVKYVGFNPALTGSSTLIWILHYQTI